VKNLLELINSNLCGPLQTMLIDKVKYFFIFIVDYNKMIVV
jgi:hypothetical protein